MMVRLMLAFLHFIPLRITMQDTGVTYSDGDNTTYSTWSNDTLPWMDTSPMNSTSLVTTVATTPVTTTARARTTPANVPSHHISKLSQTVMDLAINFYKVLQKEYPRKNLLFSPICLATGLSMTYAGSRGVTKNLLEKILNINSLQTPDFDIHATFHNVLRLLDVDTSNTTVNLVNAVFGSKGYHFKKEFSNLMYDMYSTETISLDFTDTNERSRQYINQWIANKTNDIIKEPIKPGNLHAPIILLILNVAYFKGSWANPFDAKDTKLKQFYIAPNIGINMYMMEKKKLKLFYGDAPRLKSKILELPFEGSAISFYVIVPDDIKGLGFVESQMTSAIIWNDLTKMVFVDVELVLPRFKLDVGIYLRRALSMLGLQQLLSPSLSDLSGIADKARVFLSGMMQKSVLELTEEGVEVATMMGQRIALSAMNTVFQVNVDHPFLFFIMDKRTQMTLFIGRVVYPPEGSDSLGDLKLQQEVTVSAATTCFTSTISLLTTCMAFIFWTNRS